MKNLFFLTFVVLGLTAEAQNKAEITFEVNGVCGMCEDRIEQALDAPGIIMADWDVKSKQLTVAFKTKKIKEKAKDEVYANLHGCCKYRDGASCSGEDDEGHDDQD